MQTDPGESASLTTGVPIGSPGAGDLISSTPGLSASLASSGPSTDTTTSFGTTDRGDATAGTETATRLTTT